MSVEFDEEKKQVYRGTGPEKPRTGSKMGDWLVLSGVAKNAKSANIILSILAVCIFGLSLYFFVFGFHAPHSLAPVRADVKIPAGLHRATTTPVR
jgi:hypothetical protein